MRTTPKKKFKKRGHPPLERLSWSLASLNPAGKAAWLERRLQVDPNYGWLFVLGVNNSGTTLVKRLLQDHPEMRPLPREGQELSHALPRGTDFRIPRAWGLLADKFHWTEEHDPEPSFRVKFDWAPYFPARPGYLLDKSPTNTMRSRWLQQNFRPARFLAIVRHPYPICEGIRRRNGRDLESAARHWTTAMETMFADIEHLEKCLWFRYEDLTSEPEKTVERIEAFLEVKNRLDRSVLTNIKVHSIEGVTTGVKSLNEKSLANLTEEDRRIIRAQALPMMERLGYEG